MCQLLGVSASRPLRLSFSWQHFVLRGSEEDGNPDGWGVAYVDGKDAGVVREPAPAAESPLVKFLARSGPASDLVISHVRRATMGARSLANTHPFARRMGGRVHVFAHNGFVPPEGVDQDSVWLQPVGQTDSEILFCNLLRELAPLWAQSEKPSLAARSDVVAGFAARERGRGAFNFLYWDGLTLFAHGHRKTAPGSKISTDPGLYVLERPPLTDHGLCRGITGAGDCQAIVLVATKPLDDQNWLPLAHGELLRIEQGSIV